jgi:hypothetical protein
MATTVTVTNDLAISANFVARRGDTFKWWIQFKKNGVEENLSANTYQMQVRSPTALIMEFSTASDPLTHDILIQELGGGVLVLEVSAAHMQNYELGVYDYDLQETNPDGIVRTRLQGTFSITKDITVIAP